MSYIQGVSILSVNIFRGDKRPIGYKTPKNTLLQIFIKIEPVDQKLPEGG